MQGLYMLRHNENTFGNKQPYTESIPSSKPIEGIFSNIDAPLTSQIQN